MVAGLMIVRELNLGLLVPSGYAFSVYLVVLVPLVLICTFIGAAVGPARKSAADIFSTRLTNYNRAPVPLVLASTFAVVLLLLTRVAPAPNNPNGAVFMILVDCFFALLTGVCLYFATRPVWYVEVGPSISVRRLLRTHFYSHHELKNWGFEIKPGQLWQSEFRGRCNCHFFFTDDRTSTIEVDGRDSAAVVRLLQNAGAATGNR